MAENIVESIFASQQALAAEYPNDYKNAFDLHKKHLFYGRIDDEGDAIHLIDSNLKQIESGRTGTHLAVDFVCDAFSDLRKNLRTAANLGYVSKDGLFPTNILVKKSWTNGDLPFSYNAYINKLYTNFVDSYLSVDRRADKIKNYSDFVKEFLRYALRVIDYFPITRTGFLTSIHSSPFVSGLMIEVAKERHGVQNNERVAQYLEDDNFSFFVNEVKKFGFMVDKNAPWRMVYNLASGHSHKQETGNLRGAQLYMDRFAVSFENVFKSYYRKAYLDEILNLRKQFYSLYESFYLQFSTFQETKYVTCDKGATDLKSTFAINDHVLGRVVVERKDREPPPAFGGEQEADIEYWLRILLKLRLTETRTHHDALNFNLFSVEAVKRHRLFGTQEALKYINNLTKGFHVTKFLSKGSFWYGISEKEYLIRKEDIKENALNPGNVDYGLTGTGNVK